MVYSEGEAICIDPYDPELICQICSEKGLQLKMICNTHSHKDHTKGNLELQSLTKAEISSHPLAPVPGKTRDLHPGMNFFQKEDGALTAHATPGHTDCSLSLVLRRQNKEIAIFSGDTVFNAGVGNCKNGGNVSQLFESIYKTYQAIAGDCLLCPGHDYWENNGKFVQSLGFNGLLDEEMAIAQNKYNSGDFHLVNLTKERGYNPFLVSKNEEDFKSLRFRRDQW